MKRERIKAGMILDRLEKCVEGEVEMTAQQVQAARILLGKVLPDLSAGTMESSVSVKDDTKPRDADEKKARAILTVINGK